MIVTTTRRLVGLLPAVLAVIPSVSGAATPRDPLKVPPRSVLVSTNLSIAGDRSATLVEFITGQRSEKEGIGLLLGIHRKEGEKQVLIASRDWNVEAGGFVSRASLEVTDLDRDGTPEILVYYHSHELPGTMRVALDILKLEGERLHLAWSGPFKIDTMGSDAALPPQDRERYTREIDYLRTAAEQGRRVVFKKTTYAAAGVTLSAPIGVLEELELATASASPRGGS